MRDRYLSLAVTLAAGAMIACSDGAVEEITAPKLAEMPATPVAKKPASSSKAKTAKTAKAAKAPKTAKKKASTKAKR